MRKKSSKSRKPLDMAEKMFGENGREEFHQVGQRALLELKHAQEMSERDAEISRLRNKNSSLVEQVQELEESRETNIQDRERVITHRTNKVGQYSNINSNIPFR